MSKKLISAALTATTFAWAVGVAFMPVANAQTTSTSTLEAQIAALLAQINTLQSQLKASTSSTTTTTTAAYSFSKDLTLGSTGADVTALQNLLISAGDLNITTATTYFGALTKAALAKYQAANNISPAAGYFGPKTRAFVNSLSVSTGTTTTGTTTTTTGTTTTGTTTTTTTTTGTSTTVVAPATGLSVSLASTNPATGALISSLSGGAGAARVPVLAVNFTAGNAAGVTVSEVKFHKVGVLSDSSVSGAYLIQNGKVLYQYNSLNQGVIDFSGMSLSVPAGQTVTLVLAIDVSGGLSAGNTTSFSLNAATDVSAVDANNNVITSTGTFPVNGNVFTVTNVSNPSLAAVTISKTSVGNQVTAGTQNNLVGAWNFNVNNSKVYLNGINFHIIGSANKGDIRNVKLMVNGTQVGSTLTTVAQDGTAYFDLSSNPGVLNTGSNNVQVFADVMGSPSYNFQFEILNSYDVLAIDSQYSVPVSANSNAGTQVNIQQGQTTITQDAATPTGNIAKGQSSITLAKFDVYAAGEAVKILNLPFSLTFTGVTASTTVSSLVQNISIVDDAGGQVGTTINIPLSQGSNGAFTGGVYTDSFGTNSSPINYQIPANTTRVLSLKADIQSGATFTTVTGAIEQGNNNMQGMISSAIGSTSGATGSALTLAQSSLTVAQNNALGNQNVSAGVSNLNVGSYAFTASSAEGVNINNVSVTMGGTSGVKESFQNLKLMINGTQFGTTQGTLALGGVYTFSGTPFVVPAGQTVNVNVYADTLSSASSSDADISPVTYLSGFSGTGAISYTSVSLAGGNVTGQSLTFAGQSSISIAANNNSIPASQIVMGSTANILGSYNLQETSNVENVKVTDLQVNSVVTGGATTPLAGINNLSIYSGSTLLGQAGSAVFSTSTTGTSAFTYSFHFGTPIVVPQNSFTQITLKGDVASYTQNGATDNSSVVFTIPTSTIIALGQTSNKTSNVAVVGNIATNAMTIVRNTLSVTGSSAIATARSAGLTSIGTITLTAGSAGASAVDLNTMKVTFGGNGYQNNYSATSSTSTLLNGVVLWTNGGVPLSGVSSTVSASSTQGTVTFTFSTSTATTIVPNSPVTLSLMAPLGTIPTLANISESLSAVIQSNTDVSYFDGTDQTTVSNSSNAINLPASNNNITISSLTWTN